MGKQGHTQGQKGNPASIRQANPKRIANRAASWRRAQIKHRENAERSAALHAERVENGGKGRRELRRVGLVTQPPAE